MGNVLLALVGFLLTVNPVVALAATATVGGLYAAIFVLLRSHLMRLGQETVQELADAMDACADTDHAALERMGLAGRQRMLARHDIDDQAAQFLALLQDPAP